MFSVEAAAAVVARRRAGCRVEVGVTSAGLSEEVDGVAAAVCAAGASARGFRGVGVRL